MEHKLTFDQLPDAVAQLGQKLEQIEKLLLQKNNAIYEQPDKLLTIQQAAEFLNLSVTTLYSKVSRGELPVMKRGKRLYFSSDELMQYLKDGRKQSFVNILASNNR